MKYNLETIEAYLASHLPVQLTGSDCATLESHRRAIEDLFMQAHRQIKTNMPEFTSEVSANFFVLLHTTALTRIDRELYTFYQQAQQGKEPQHQCLQTFYRQIGGQVCSLLLDLRALAPQYFDLHLPVPFFLQMQEAAIVLPELKIFRRLKKMLDHHNAPLATLLEQMLARYFETDLPLTYHQLDYIKRLVAGLHPLAEKKEGDHNFMLNRYLINHNFNAPEYIDRCIDKLSEKFGNAPIPDRISALSAYGKEMAKLVPHENDFFFKGYPRALDVLHTWVKYEIEGLEKAISTMGKTPEQHEKIPLTLTVAEFAAIVKAGLVTGVIDHPNQAAVFRLFIRYFRCPKAEDISDTSFTNKAHYPDQAGVVGGIKKLQDIIAQLRTM